MTTNIVYVEGDRRFIYPLTSTATVGKFRDYLGADNMTFPGSYAEITNSASFPNGRVHVNFAEPIDGGEFFKRCDGFLLSRLVRT